MILSATVVWLELYTLTKYSWKCSIDSNSKVQLIRTRGISAALASVS